MKRKVQKQMNYLQSQKWQPKSLTLSISLFFCSTSDSVRKGFLLLKIHYTFLQSPFCPPNKLSQHNNTLITVILLSSPKIVKFLTMIFCHFQQQFILCFCTVSTITWKTNNILTIYALIHQFCQSFHRISDLIQRDSGVIEDQQTLGLRTRRLPGGRHCQQG